MTTQVIQKNELQQLLKKVQRKTVEGFLVDSCVLCVKPYELYVTSLVKDGVSSVARFSLSASSEPFHEPEGNVYDLRIPVPSISHLLNVLKYHSQTVKLIYESDKLKIVSGKKTTTLATSFRAKATSSSPDTLEEWSNKSEAIAKKISFPKYGPSTYTLESGEENVAKLSFAVDSTDLFEALRCDGINGKKQGKYNFVFDGDGFHVDVGSQAQGHTRTTVSAEVNVDSYSMAFEGGLEEVMKPIVGEVMLNFHNFPKRGSRAGAWALLITIDNDFVYQMSVSA